MTVSGDAAKGYDVVRLDSFAIVNQGELLSADDATGRVQWRTLNGEVKDITLGAQMIRLVPKYPR